MNGRRKLGLLVSIASLAVLGTFFSNCAQQLPSDVAAQQSSTAPAPVSQTTDPLVLTPSNVTVISGLTTMFTASGGQPPYQYKVISGVSTIDATGKFTAGAVAETATVQVIDASANATTAQAVVQIPARVCGNVGENAVMTLTCPTGTKFKAIQFASYGTPTGTCGGFAVSTCNASTSMATVQSLCLNQATCAIGANNTVFAMDPCGGTKKALAVQAICY